MTKIVQSGDRVLRLKAKDVPVKDIGSKRIQGIIADMRKALRSQDDGVAIAAPQIGHSLRIFMVAGMAFDIENNIESDGKSPASPDLVCINPVITKLSKDKKDMDEGCLSVRYLYGKVRRSSKATVTAYDEHGKKFTRGAKGLISQIFQHETDHLDGILFIDKAKDMINIPPKGERSS